MPLKVCIVGSGNWGSAIAKIIGSNVTKFDDFDNTVTIYVYEELINGKKLSEIINETHENVKYLPGHQLPPNIVAEPNIEKSVSDADILVFVVPHQFIKPQLEQIKNAIKPTAVGLSLVKGFHMPEGGGIQLVSTMIKDILNIDVSVLMGANLANEVADENFCETTIGSRHPVYAPLFRKLINTENFLVSVVDDVEGVEMCGALKNIVGCAAGVVDGLGLGDNTKSAVIRIGLVEMVKFCRLQSPQTKLSVFFQSCGIADLITTCYGGRNRRVCEAFVTYAGAKTIPELEKEMLNGQKLQGPDTAEEVCHILKNTQHENEFPFFNAINETLKGEIEPKEFIDRLRHNPSELNW